MHNTYLTQLKFCFPFYFFPERFFTYEGFLKKRTNNNNKTILFITQMGQKSYQTKSIKRFFPLTKNCQIRLLGYSPSVLGTWLF